MRPGSQGDSGMAYFTEAPGIKNHHDNGPRLPIQLWDHMPQICNMILAVTWAYIYVSIRYVISGKSL